MMLDIEIIVQKGPALMFAKPIPDKVLSMANFNYSTLHESKDIMMKASSGVKVKAFSWTAGVPGPFPSGVTIFSIC